MSSADLDSTSEPLLLEVSILLPKATQNQLIRLRAAELLGRGAYGSVYRAETETGETVALKITHVSSDIIDPREFGRAERTLLREFVAGRKLRHSLIAEVLYIGSVRWNGERRLCVVSEFVEGNELRREYGKLTTDEQRSRVLLHMARGLKVIHDAGIVHRDLSSRNVMLTPGGETKILDFGISFFLLLTLSSLSLPIEAVTRDTDPTAIKPRGNPPYMAPEVWSPRLYETSGGPSFDPTTGLYVPSPASDIFALGVIAYELFAGGRHPFGILEMTNDEMCQAICAPHRVVSWPAGTTASSTIRKIIERCLVCSPRDRPSLDEIIAVLAPPPPRETLPVTPRYDHTHDDYGPDWNECVFDSDGNCINSNQKHWGANE